MNVAALYVDTARGPYPHIPGVDCWDAERDALHFPGGCPVIAHPPCGAWGSLKELATRQRAVKHLATVAVHQVIACGGVLEHPRGSELWNVCGLPLPCQTIPLDVHGAWALEIDQCRFGHQALKKTWLFFCGVHPQALPSIPPPRTPTHCVTPTRKRVGGLSEMKKSERHLTPPAFAEWLVKAARNAEPAVLRLPTSVL